MTDITYNFNIFQGADFSLNVELKDSLGVARNLTGKSFRGMARRRIEDTLPAFEFVFTPIDLSIGTFSIKITSDTTTGLSDRRITKFVYDVEMFLGADVERILMGEITMYPEVTR